MTVKECARELGVSVVLVREMLRTGLIAGHKQANGWHIPSSSLEALRQSLALLRSSGEADRNCFSWLYESDFHTPPDLTGVKPWKAVTPRNAGSWLGNQPAQCPACQKEMVTTLDANLGQAQHCPPCGIWDVQSTSTHRVSPA